MNKKHYACRSVIHGWTHSLNISDKKIQTPKEWYYCQAKTLQSNKDSSIKKVVQRQRCK
jgi:hypothetical protein